MYHFHISVTKLRHTVLSTGSVLFHRRSYFLVSQLLSCSKEGEGVILCDIEALIMRRPRPKMGCCATVGGNKQKWEIWSHCVIQYCELTTSLLLNYWHCTVRKYRGQGKNYWNRPHFVDNTSMNCVIFQAPSHNCGKRLLASSCVCVRLSVRPSACMKKSVPT